MLGDDDATTKTAPPFPSTAEEEKMLKDKASQYSGLLQMFPQPHKCDVILNAI